MMLTRYVENIALKIGMRVEQLTWVLHELDRMTRFLFEETPNDENAIDRWLAGAEFGVDEDGFFQSRSLLNAYRRGEHPAHAISCSWGKNLQMDKVARFRQYALRNIGQPLLEIHKRLPFAAWIYYQDVSNTAIQFPFIDQKTAIPWNFNWHEYHTFVSVSPRNNPTKAIQWTQPSIDYAGEGLIISVSKPLYTGVDADWFTGLWSIDVPIRKLHADCIGEPLFLEQETFIIDKNRQFITHPKIPALIEKKEGSIFRDSIDILGDGFSELTFQGLKIREKDPFDIWNNQEALVISSCTIPFLDWVLMSTVPKRVLNEAVTQRMGSVLRNIKAGDLSERIQLETMPEHWRPLIDALNDMTESLQAAHIREKHLSAVIQSVRKVNQLIVQERSAVPLIQMACDILVQTRDYRHAWIALIDKDGCLEQLVEAGFEKALSPLRMLLDGAERPYYVTRAINQTNIVLTEAGDSANARCPISRHFPDADKLTVCLAHDGIIYGILSITVQRQTIDDEELALVRQLAGDLGVALHGIALQTEQRRTAEALVKLNDELEQRVENRTIELQVANEELEAFSYSVSHDLRAPLRAISGFSTVLLEDQGDRLDAEGVDALNRIVRGVEHMARLIDELLKLSRVSRVALRVEEVDLSAMAEEIVESLRHGSPERKVTVNLAPNLKAYGDPSLLYVVLQNLLDNAWKFTVNTSAPLIEWGREDSPEGGYFYVRDNGAGFEMAFADRLFEAFQRIHSDPDYPGSGIGLAAAARAVHRHGGKIWGEGEVGKGALFGFTLKAKSISILPTAAGESPLCH